MSLLLVLSACRPEGAGAALVLNVEPSEGAFPLAVTLGATFDDGTPADASWDLGDGEQVTGAEVTHTYVGEGVFDVSASIDDLTAAATVDVTLPDCPELRDPQVWGVITDSELLEISGVTQSWLDPGVLWIHEDAGNPDEIISIGTSGVVIARFEVLGLVGDFEDIGSALDPETGEALLFLADIGDNNFDNEPAVWVVPEPLSTLGGNLEGGLRMALVWPGGADWNAEALLVDPLTLDLFIVTKDAGGEAAVFVKRPPHDTAGPHILERVETLDFATPPLAGGSTTGGAVSPAGDRVVIRTYQSTGWLWRRDGLLPLEAAFEGDPCGIDLPSLPQGEAVAFTTDGLGMISISEGSGSTIWYSPFRK